MKTLSLTKIKDFPIEKYNFNNSYGTWYAFENDISQLYTVICLLLE